MGNKLWDEAETFECPKCGERRKHPFAKEIMHNCPKARKNVVFKKVKT